MKTRNTSHGIQKMVALLSGIILLAFSGIAVAGILGSAHDFSSTNVTWQSATDEICVFCHAPHNAAGASNGPLWNRAYQATGTDFTMYDDSILGSDLDGTLDASLSGVALLCMSCHDGTTAVDAYGGGAGTELIGGVNINRADADFGTDLGNDHPVNITYTTGTAGTDGELYDPSTQTVAKLNNGTIQNAMLSGDKVVCASCHDVHATEGDSTTAVALLKIDNSAQSALCLTCHNK